ncbi:glycosyltransferase, partial [Dictyobacter arantiisoli]|uniref:glycosyltransferase n=1 Tax=Dictyobacter arantiisoli TaxID=2014874 RepID=UPI00155A80FF
DFQPAELQVGEIHPAELTSLLNLLYQNPAMRQHYSQQAHTYATAARFHWDTIARQWDQLFQSQLNT